MFAKTTYSGTLAEQYELLSKQLEALCQGESDAIANYSNASALLNQFLTDINWVGFYFMKAGELVLGPFQAYLHVYVFQLGVVFAEQPLPTRKPLSLMMYTRFPVISLVTLRPNLKS